MKPLGPFGPPVCLASLNHPVHEDDYGDGDDHNNNDDYNDNDLFWTVLMQFVFGTKRLPCFV